MRKIICGNDYYYILIHLLRYSIHDFKPRIRQLGPPPNLNQRHQKTEGFRWKTGGLRNCESKILQVNIFSLSVGCQGYWCKFIRILLRVHAIVWTPNYSELQLVFSCCDCIAHLSHVLCLGMFCPTQCLNVIDALSSAKHTLSSSMTREEGWVINDGVIKRTGKRLGFLKVFEDCSRMFGG